MVFDVNEFDNMRPYRDDEIAAAMQRIVTDRHFAMIASFVFPSMSIEECSRTVAGYETVYEFQHDAMRRVNERIIEDSTEGLSCSGAEGLDTSKRYLFISNHRDIMLDACFLQYCLWKKGHETSEITFGANLMGMPIVDDIGKSNKMFRVERGGSIREFYKSSLLLSKYIRYTICNKKQSVWIAQRNGRTKDGNDRTEPGLIKMFTLSAPELKAGEALAELNIVPMSVSYEWEPCDILKAAELYQSQFGRYVKKEGEDLNSILTGIRQPKGRVHISLCSAVTPQEWADIDGGDTAAFLPKAARIIDERIWDNYHLYPNNYVAADLLGGDGAYSDNYSEAQKAAFLQHLECVNLYPEQWRPQLQQIMLNIYANPVKNRFRK